MSNEQIEMIIDDALETLIKTLSNVKRALSSANIAVGLAEAYNQGLNDAWELARKIVLDVSKGGIPERNMRSMFGEKWTVSDILKNYTPQEALAKLEAYEKEIEVGDVVRLKGSDKEYVVTTIDEDRCSEIYCGVSKDGAWFAQCNVEKTGKHIDIKSVLQQIGGGVDA